MTLIFSLSNQPAIGSDKLSTRITEWTIEVVENNVPNTTDGIKARYTVRGQVVEGYNYESPAIYATFSLWILKVFLP